MNSWLRYLPLGVVVAAILYLVYAMLPVEEPASTMQVHEFGKAFVQDHGRIKPYDTLSRYTLLIISGRQTYFDKDGNEHPAIEWLLDVATSTAGKRDAADNSLDSAKVMAFRIDDATVRATAGLKDRSPPLYSYEELEPTLNALFLAMRDRIQAAADPDEAERLRDQFLELAKQFQAYDHYSLYETPHRVFRIDNDQLLALLGLEARSGFRYAYSEFVPRMGQLINEADRIGKVPVKDRTAYEKKAGELAGHVQLYAGLANLRADKLQVVPPTRAGQEWRTLQDTIRDEKEEGVHSPGADGLRKVLVAYAEKDAPKFNKAVAEYRALQDAAMPHEGAMAPFEVAFNHFAPFYQCTLLYVCVFLFAAISWLVCDRPLGRTAFWLCVVALAIQSAALIARMVMQGRPPVTNLYSSAVFVGWACVGLGIILEWLFPYAIAIAAAAVLGFSTALLAHLLGGSGDSMEMLEAVLDTNFWLATHVTAVTIGYASTLLAGVLGILYILYGLIGRPGSASILKTVSVMVYGIVCFATLFSFTGTVLGGIWADQSWGRFWGWDPKENGALIIVIWNALLLHARWAGMIKQRGVAVLSVIGIMVTIWSWIGTNQLEIGLHSYGFNNTLASVARWTWGGSLLFIAVGALTPLRYWRALKPEPILDALPARPRLKPA